MTVCTFPSSETISETPFMYLTCDLPAPPLYPDELRENIIPQVPIFQILNKFNGLMEKEYKTYKDSTMRRFEITRLPPYIILYMKVGCSCGAALVMGYVTESAINVNLWLPQMLISSCLYLQRFNKNTFILEKNNTIVNFPVKWVLSLSGHFSWCTLDIINWYYGYRNL